MSTLVCLLEEQSAAVMLEAVLPKILPDGTQCKFVTFEGKQDLEKKLTRRIQHWQEPDSFFLVMRDQDSGDCVSIKNGLKELVAQAGKADRTIVRIACHELESFYLGDLAAVENGLAIRGLANQQGKAKFRTPDTLNNAAEELKKISANKYQKINGSRSIAPFLAVDGTNRSVSFNVLIAGINKLFSAKQETSD